MLGLIEGESWVQLPQRDAGGLLEHLETALARDSGKLKLFSILPEMLLGKTRCIWEQSGCLQKAVY